MNTDPGWNDMKKGHHYTFNFLRYKQDNDSKNILARGARLKDLNYFCASQVGIEDNEMNAIGLAQELVSYCHRLKLKFEQNVNGVSALATFTRILKNGDNTVLELANSVEQHYNFTIKAMD